MTLFNTDVTLKDHVTLKTGVIMINSALITGINYTLLYIFTQRTDDLHWSNITHTVFLIK